MTRDCSLLRADGDMLNIDKFKGIFSSVATVATAGKLSKENFLLHLKECVLLYFTAFVAFQDAVTSVAK